MQTKQFEEPRALSLQEMEEVNGGGYEKFACYAGVGVAYAAMVAAAAASAGLLGGALAVAGFVLSTACTGE